MIIFDDVPIGKKRIRANARMKIGCELQPIENCRCKIKKPLIFCLIFVFVRKKNTCNRKKKETKEKTHHDITITITASWLPSLHRILHRYILFYIVTSSVMIKKHKQEFRGLNTIDCSGGRRRGSKKRKYDNENTTFLSCPRLEKRKKRANTQILAHKKMQLRVHLQTQYLVLTHF